MALIPGYEYDIFISYAHVDNIAFPGQTDGWIEQFYKNLNLTLAKRFGRMDMVKFWWDHQKLDGSKLFDSSIEAGIKKTAVFICLISPGYLESEYCINELELFHGKAKHEKQGLIIGEHTRILNVMLNNIPSNKLPKQLEGIQKFIFHDAEQSEDFGDPLDTLSAEFKNQIHMLRDTIWNLLNEFNNSTKEGGQIEEDLLTENDDDNFTIFLGEVADTLRTPRKRIIIELEKKGYKVITGIPPPNELNAHNKKTKEALEIADLAIHLFDEYPGRDIEGVPDLWYPQQQALIGLELAKSQMIWVPAETDFETIEDEKYKSFLIELEAGKETHKGYEFVRSSKITLAQEIIDLAEQLRNQNLNRKSSSERLSVLLDTHFNDQIYALDLSKTLLENQIQPFINPQEDDPRKNIHLLGDRISQVKKLIFLYGNVSKEWVMERVSAALQLIITNNYPIEDFFIYLAPPTKEANNISIKQRLLKLNIVDCSHNESIDQSAMHQFLLDLKSNNL